MCKILIFGGTTEGRLLAEYCHESGIRAMVSVASGYGRDVLPQSCYLEILTERLDEAAIFKLLCREKPEWVFDATHPFAVMVTQNICTACEKTGTAYRRIIRTTEPGDEENRDVVWVSSVQEAVRYLEGTKGNILVTTGSKELSAYRELTDFTERVFARVLPSSSVLASCEAMGLTGRHLIGMQGPFSRELNRAMLEQLAIRFLVTKEAGAAGGYVQKLEAAMDWGCTTVVIGRPKEETGITVEEAKQVIASYETRNPRRVSLIGIGMGGRGQLTQEAAAVLAQCDVVFGAKRMVESVEPLDAGVHRELMYTSSQILPWLEENSRYRQIVILYSGDTGFYSGAGKMAEALEAGLYRGKYHVRVYPGISSVAYLSARLKKSWDDVSLGSLHGRDWDIAAELRAHAKVFTLLGGEHTVKELCTTLLSHGFGQVMMSVGERLSYPEERIVTGTPEEILELNLEFDGLCAVFIERKQP